MTNTDNEKQVQAPSSLFLVRLRAATPGGKEEWCGRVQHVISGKAYTFCRLEDLPGLMITMQRHLNNTEQ